MSLKVQGTVSLLNGRFDFDKTNPSAGPSVILDRVLYGYLTSAALLDAVVVLGYHTGGTANWQYVYAFGLTSDEPKLVDWFRAGSRADFGLYGVEVGNRSLTVDLLDPARRIADCCSKGFVRTRMTSATGTSSKGDRRSSVRWRNPSQRLETNLTNNVVSQKLPTLLTKSSGAA